MKLLSALERIAAAVEAQTDALNRVAETNLMLLDELTSEPDQGGDAAEEGDTFLDGTPKH